MNLFKLANENSINLKNQYNNLKENYYELEELEKFSNIIEECWKLSINLKLSDLKLFLINGRYKNIYEYKRVQYQKLKNKKSAIPLNAAIERRLKRYYKLREKFNCKFKDSRFFKYCSLNIEGLGIKYYGEFCVIIQREKSEGFSALTFVKEDSLNYFNKNGFNMKKFRKEIANKECISYLVALKHRNDIKNISSNKIYYKICCNENYIEGFTTEDINISHVESIRMSKKDLDKYYDCLLKDYESEIPEYEKYMVKDYLELFELLEKCEIEREVILENEN